MLDREIVINELRMKEQLKEVEQYRLAKEAQKANNKSGTPIYGPALAQIGDKLVELGHNLQERYGELKDMPLSVAEADCQPGTV